MQAGQRHLGGAHQVHVVALEVVDLLVVRVQEAGALHDVRAHQHRRDHELEAGLARLLGGEHEHAQLQPGAVAGQVVEARAADLGAALHVDNPQRLCQVQVVFDLEVEFGHFADVLDYDEVLLAAGRRTLDDVGDGVLQLLQLLLRGGLLRLGLFHAGLELVGAFQQRRAVLGGGLADLLAKRLLLGAQLVRLLDGGAAGLVGGQQLVHKRRVFAAGPLGLADGLGVFAHTLQINHACSPYIVCRPCNGRTTSGHNQCAMVGV